MPRVLYVARHGETDWNVAGRWQGHTDVPLNSMGRLQAKALADRLRTLPLRAAVASDLSRAQETALIVAGALGFGVPYVDPGLRERSFGPFEGLTRAECASRYPEAWSAWEKNRVPPGDAETLETLTSRVVTAAERAAREAATDAEGALVVTHGGALRALVAAITGEMPAFVQNGDVWRLDWADRFVDAQQL